MVTSKENIELAKELKKLVEQVKNYEIVLYEILDERNINVIKEMVADALGEDLEIYMEKDTVDIFEAPDGDLPYYDEEE